MKKIYWFMIILSSIIIILSCVISIKETDYEEAVIGRLTIECMTDDKAIRLVLWKDENEDRFYLFLPSWYAKKDKSMTFRYEDWIGVLRLDGETVRNRDVWTDDGNEEIHTLEVYDRKGVCHLESTLQVLTSENLPALFVTVEDRKDLLKFEKFDNKKYIEAGTAIMVDEQGDLLWDERLNKFKVRGNLTATFDKKPFTFSFFKPREVLGMEPALKWNLIANATDGSYIRNKVIRDLAYESVEAYEPQGEYVEVYLNGEYQGLYLLTEAVEIAENRIEIDPKNSWFIEMELDFRAREDTTRIITDRGQIFIVHSEDILTKEELGIIERRLNDVESALFAEDGISEKSGKALEELIDLDSFAEAWLIEELSGDHDIGITSQFAYASREEDSLWYSGPAWDFDGIMGNVNTPMYGVPEALTSIVWMSRPEDNNNQNRWLAAMWKHPEFREIVIQKYCSVFRENYKKELDSGIEEDIRVIRRSTLLDTLRWHTERKGWWFTVPEELQDIKDKKERQGEDYHCFDTLDEHVAVVRNFMSEKLAFLDKLWIEQRDFCVVEVRNPAPFLDQGYNQTLYYWVERGTALEHLPDYEHPDYSFRGYFDMETGEQVENGYVVEKDCVIEGIWIREVDK